eukprot:CAMPEP_0202765096 /NCGR_PEP_ID=MMETSP1388-20130828/27395_1 /ASSEMBLY_ACC=CAM_ASM_000864 /TAXON_ID=37098 /ORGANISM="Isochrysis sp, Strain CCMP1244" /LENGTH=40 /DNA_ID= /DNA_START= /DNA_END= /DNA_ORIENTATION=
MAAVVAHRPGHDTVAGPNARAQPRELLSSAFSYAAQALSR